MSTDFIICLFGGWCGLHCFVKGNWKKGILYLFTFGLFGIGWIVDVISIYNKDKELKTQNAIAQDKMKRKMREKNNLIFHEKIKAVETVHPNRQRLLKDICFISEHGESPCLITEFNNNSLDIFYIPIDSDKFKPIGKIYEYSNELTRYDNSIDHEVKIDYNVCKENDVYVLYIDVKVYN